MWAQVVDEMSCIAREDVSPIFIACMPESVVASSHQCANRTLPDQPRSPLPAGVGRRRADALLHGSHPHAFHRRDGISVEAERPLHLPRGNDAV